MATARTGTDTPLVRSRLLWLALLAALAAVCITPGSYTIGVSVVVSGVTVNDHTHLATITAQ